MMKIYLDREYRCHLTETDNTVLSAETEVFDGKCDAFIEGYRFVPIGESWTRSDGVVFYGEMVAPWKDINILTAYQEQYEAMQIKKEGSV